VVRPTVAKATATVDAKNQRRFINSSSLQGILLGRNESPEGLL
jgi:hypothetical protein